MMKMMTLKGRRSWDEFSRFNELCFVKSYTGFGVHSHHSWKLVFIVIVCASFFVKTFLATFAVLNYRYGQHSVHKYFIITIYNRLLLSFSGSFSNILRSFPLMYGCGRLTPFNHNCWADCVLCDTPLTIMQLQL